MKDRIELKLKLEELEKEDPDFSSPTTEAKVNAIQFLLEDGDPITEEDMPIPKTDEDIDKLIAILRQERIKLPHYSFFGDDNWTNIDASIEICEWAKGS